MNPPPSLPPPLSSFAMAPPALEARFLGALAEVRTTPRRAIDTLAALSAANPGDPCLRAALGAAHLAAGDIAAADRHLQAARSLPTKDAQAPHLLALVALAGKREVYGFRQEVMGKL